MLSLREVFARLGYEIENPFDRLRFRIKRRMGWLRPVKILPYYGYGTSQEFYIKGRVLEDQDITRAPENSTLWQNLRAMYRRFESDEIPGVLVEVRFGKIKKKVLTDDEGYLDAHLALNDPAPKDSLWHDVQIEMLDDILKGQGKVTATGKVLVPYSDSNFGVISDIDDTVIKTHANDLLKMLRLILFGSARTRLPFKGVAEFYRALEKGTDDNNSNPIFYVSSSPWNLYDLLVDFMEVRGIPKGPLFLRDLGIDRTKLFDTGHQSHKLEQIRRIMDTYPELQFILIGDSGQKDPEIYKQVVSEFPGRILAVYIRDVTRGLRENELTGIANELSEKGTDMILAEDTVQAAEHAAERGFIKPEMLSLIRGEKE